MGSIRFPYVPYDSTEYAETLKHIGHPMSIPGLPWPILIRDIPGTRCKDAVGPWPYGSSMEPSGLVEAIPRMKELGLVTLTACVRPDCSIKAEIHNHVGIETKLLKSHYLYDSTKPPPHWSSKTRANIAKGGRAWVIKDLDLRHEWPTVACFHERLASRISFSPMTHLPSAHFQLLANVPGVIGLGAWDNDGLGAALIAVQAGDRVHFHALTGDDRAYRKQAFYALFQVAIHQWGKDRILHLGGVPHASNGPGIAHFKGRFSNGRIPVYMTTLVIDPIAYTRLISRLGRFPFSPPYRSPSPMAAI